ncbi:elongation factor G-like protein EF-G2 [Mumia zhuanghuii]|uniref:Elongation factor G-like protein EF-G2 n=2 Tax=Mumia TaxID=1546255 RepID=A0ABW1QPP5_9ACTN|nr:MULTISPECIES: elongation factor G-like protein EF-G2 [Mumia]KAA1420080.1 elongation factor G-like protein EF-G2 [Mumia zhuanghuii]
MGVKASDESRRGGQGGAAVAVQSPADLRNIAVVGPSGSGKTTLVEALLAASGTIPRAGSVEAGTTVGDHDPAAVRQHRTVGLSVAPLVHDGTKVNLIDTPGYADFVGELRAGLRAADAALFVVSATDEVDGATRAVWEECAAVGMPRALVVARIDHQRANVDGAVAGLRAALGDGVHPVYELAPDGLIGLISLRRSVYADGVRTLVDPDGADLATIGPDRDALIEAVIGESEDEELMERYLAGEPVDPEVLIRDLETAVTRGALFPVFLVSSVSGVGVADLLDAMPRAFPSPLERPLPVATDPRGAKHTPLAADPDGPFVAEVIHTEVDAYVGRVSLLRTFSGTLRPDDTVHVSGHGMADRGHEDHDADERVAHVYSALGGTLSALPYAVAGDICAVTKIGSAETGDTLSSPADPMLIDPWPMPEPLLPIAVVAKTRRDEDTLSRNLARLAAADPTLRLERNAETGQLVLWCMGESHADVVLSRLREGGADVETEPVVVALRETFSGRTSGEGRHVKQSGGHGQYAVCQIEVEPLPRGSGFTFVDKVVGGAVPRQFIPSVEKGVRSQLAKGVFEGCPVVDVRVTLTGGKAHSVDSSDAAFQTAGALALKDAASRAHGVLLEPVDEVAVEVPDEYLGTVLEDLSSRRGRVQGTEAADGGRSVVRAAVPATELLSYSVVLRSLTSGAASFTRAFAHYEVLPEGAAARSRLR